LIPWGASLRAVPDVSIYPLLFFSLLLTGCGFQLRDQADLPDGMARTHIAGLDQYDELHVALERVLSANGLKVVGANEASAILRVTAHERGKRVLSVDSDGKVQELELYTIVAFEIVGRGNALELRDQRLILTRNFVLNETNVLGNASEAEVLYEDMENELVRLILYRLQAAG
jgi:LPS-assembly lipoprotein